MPGGRPGRGFGGDRHDERGTGRGRRGDARGPCGRRQDHELLDLPIDGRGEGERIELIAKPHERDHGLGIRLGARLDSLERRARSIVAATKARPDPFFAEELDRGQEEVVEEPQLVPIERVQRHHGRRGVVPPVPHELADVRPVLLLDVGVVVLLVRPAARELDLLGLAVAVEMVVDELGAVVGVDPPEAEGQDLSDLLQGRLDAGFAATEDGPGLHPRRVDVGHVQRMGELAIGPVAGVGHQVELGEAGGGDVPVVGLQRDVVLEQGPGLGPAIAARRELPLDGRQASVDLARTDGAELLAHGGGEPEAPAGPGQPEGQQRFQPHRPGIPGGLPDRGQRLDHRQPVRGGAPPAAGPLGTRGRAVEKPQRVLALVARGLTELIEDPPPLDPGRAPVARVDGREDLPPRTATHHVTLLRPRGPRELHSKWRVSSCSVSF